MANTAAHLVDHVLPDVSLRQWVLSLPFDLQSLAARDPRLLSSVLRIFVDRHLHFHVLVLDGVYAPGKDGESLVFHSSPSPTADDVHSLTMTMLRRTRTLLKRRGLLDPKDDAAESETPHRKKRIHRRGAEIAESKK